MSGAATSSGACSGELREIPGGVLEVGVWRGGTGAILAARAQGLGIEEPVILCDTWEGVVKTGDVDIYYRDGKHGDTSQATVEGLMRRLGLSNVELLKGIFPEETGAAIADRAFRLCHVDVDVYQSAKDVFELGLVPPLAGRRRGLRRLRLPGMPWRDPVRR